MPYNEVIWMSGLLKLLVCDGAIMRLTLLNLLVVFGCGVASAQHFTSVQIRDVPHVVQKTDFCGEACVASWLQKIGVPADQDAVFDASGLNPKLGRGCYTKEMVTALKNLGFDPGQVWYQVPVASYTTQVGTLWKALHSDLQRGVASIICMRTSDGPGATEHFRLILGYDATKDEVIYHEPAEHGGAYQRMPRVELLKLWPLKYQRDQWTLVRFALDMKQRPQISPSVTFTSADYAQHIMDLKSRLALSLIHI